MQSLSIAQANSAWVRINREDFCQPELSRNLKIYFKLSQIEGATTVTLGDIIINTVSTLYLKITHFCLIVRKKTKIFPDHVELAQDGFFFFLLYGHVIYNFIPDFITVVMF